jgi:hypothetical protein
MYGDGGSHVGDERLAVRVERGLWKRRQVSRHQIVELDLVLAARLRDVTAITTGAVTEARGTVMKRCGCEQLLAAHAGRTSLVNTSRAQRSSIRMCPAADDVAH